MTPIRRHFWLPEVVESSIVAFMEISYQASCVFIRQCEKFPVACHSAYFLTVFGQEVGLPRMKTGSQDAEPSLLEALAFLLPLLALFGVIATGEFCDWARAQVGAIAKNLGPGAGISDTWRLHPPELADAYREWCQRQTHQRAIPWLLVGVHLFLYLRQHSTEEVSCTPFRAVLAVMCTMHLLKALLDSRLSPFGHAAIQGSTVVIRGLMAVALCLRRDQCFLALAGTFFESRIGLVMGTGISMLLFSTMICVTMEHTFSIFSLTLAVQFVFLCLRFHVTREPALTLADIDFWAVVGCLMATILGGQVALIIRYWVGISNMQCFLTARLVQPHQQPSRLHPD